MAINFPSSPTPGQTHTDAGATWVFGTYGWKLQAPSDLVAAGTYTPTTVNVANAASSTPFACQYMVVTDPTTGVRVCTVSGALTIDPTAASTSTTVRMSLPIPSAIANAQEIAGTGLSITGTTVTPVLIFGSAPNDDAAFVCVAPTTAAFTLYFTFTYRII